METLQQIFYYVNNVVIRNCVNIVLTFDALITKNLKDAGIQTRPAKSNGLWCCILLPAILIIYSMQQKVSSLYVLMAYISLGLLCYCLLFIVFISVSCLVLKEPAYGGCIASSLIVTLLLYTCLGKDLIPSLLISLPHMYLFSTLLRLALTRCPKTFTVGEAMVVLQGIVLFIGVVAIKISCNLDDEIDEEMEFITKIVYTILSTVGLIVTVLYLLGEQYRNAQALGSIVGVGAVYGLIMLHMLLGNACVINILYYIFMDRNRLRLFTFWLFLAVLAVVVILVRTKLAVKANTVTRKTFHVLASVVFLSGIITDVHLMTFAAGFGLGLLIFLEALRKLDIELVSKPLQSAFLVYSDEKDMGTFAMTPIYLYVGLACPLVLVPKHSGAPLDLLSGVLATGVGDTAASWFGSRYGFNKWSGSQKTFEGTAFNIISQVATIRVLQMFELLDVRNGLIRAAFAATVSGLVEAKTDQIDNMVISLVNILAYQATWFLC